METLQGFLLMVVIGRVIYRLVYDNFTNFKSIYFKAPEDTYNLKRSTLFSTTPGEIFKKLFWPVFALAVVIFFYWDKDAIIVILIFGFPLIFKLADRILHLRDKVILSHDRIDFSLGLSKVPIDLSDVRHIELMYFYYRNSGLTLYPILIFHTPTKSEEVKLSGSFFLQKSREVIMALKHLYPDKRYSLSWKKMNDPKPESLVLHEGRLNENDLIQPVQTSANFESAAPNRSTRLFYFPMLAFIVGGGLALLLVLNPISFLFGGFAGFGLYAVILGEILINTGVMTGIKARLIGAGLFLFGSGLMYLLYYQMISKS